MVEFATRLSVIASVLSVAITTAYGGETTAQKGNTSDWPHWRGPGWDGVSLAAGIPTDWSTERNVAWRIADPGFGHSSPIIWGKDLFYTTTKDEKRLLVRVDADTGKEIWRREVLSSPLEEKHPKNSHASATPATDGEFIYVTFYKRPDVVMAAYNFAGELQWSQTPGEFHSMHGFSSTPVLFEDFVLLNCDQDAEDAYIVAFDRKTGEIRWRTSRENKVRSYCPPIVFNVDGEPQMILCGSDTVCSYDPRTGKRNWMVWGPTEQCVASVVYDGKKNVFVTGGYPDHEFLAIDPRGKGNVTKSHIRWRRNKGVSYVPSPVYWRGNYFVVSDEGILSVLDAESGEYRKQKRLPGGYSASLVCVSGNLYCCSEDGDVTVLRATSDLQTVAEIEMGDPIYASPAIARGRLYLRTWKHLYAIGPKSPVKAD